MFVLCKVTYVRVYTHTGMCLLCLVSILCKDESVTRACKPLKRRHSPEKAPTLGKRAGNGHKKCPFTVHTVYQHFMPIYSGVGV